jgi:hypothetical protein
MSKFINPNNPSVWIIHFYDEDVNGWVPEFFADYGEAEERMEELSSFGREFVLYEGKEADY